jgi:DNA repair protein RadA/Sms
LVIVDSIQTLVDQSVEGAVGSLNQVRACAVRLIRHAKETGAAVILVGHVTKEGAIAGPKTLEHAVDSVLDLEGDRSGSMRLLRAVKNRFGSCDETGVFTMTARGLEVVIDPSAVLLADRARGATGSIVFPALQGSRPLLIEMQALVVKSDLSQPRRASIGIDAKRLALLLAVLARHQIVPKDHDVFAAAAGGIAVKEPAADLALSLALVSAARGWTLHARTVAIGEVGLGGEIRRVPEIHRRLAEAARLGFTRAFIPRGVAIDRSPLEIIEVADVGSAFSHLAEEARAAAA